jgi:hypothetical protein
VGVVEAIPIIVIAWGALEIYTASAFKFFYFGSQAEENEKAKAGA